MPQDVQSWANLDSTRMLLAIIQSQPDSLRCTRKRRAGKGRMDGQKSRGRRTPVGPTASGVNPTSLKHLAVKDFVLFLTGRAGCTDTTGHEQRRTYCDENCRAVRLKLEKPPYESV